MQFTRLPADIRSPVLAIYDHFATANVTRNNILNEPTNTQEKQRHREHVLGCEKPVSMWLEGSQRWINFVSGVVVDGAVR